MGVRRVATLKDDLAVKLVDVVGLVVGVAFVKMFPALSRYPEHLRQKQVMKWKQKSWRMISTSDISITLKWWRMKMVRKLAATVKILKIIQLTVILTTSHKLKSSLHIVIQERSGWKGEECMRGWKGGGSSTSSRRCCLGPQAQKCVI